MVKKKEYGLKEADDEVWDKVQDLLRARICQNSLPENMDGTFQSQREHLTDLIRRCATIGESNSALVIGPSGAGKTMLMSSILSELAKDSKISGNILQVHLNGLLQTDDRLAVQEITRQLRLENTVKDRVFGSMAEKLSFLLEALKKDEGKSQSILFVLEEFDLFAHHKNQTLLYNLFDISQSEQTPVTVIGLTCRLDVVELLEKRVKSRFSHRQIHLFHSLSFEQACKVCEDALTLPLNYLSKKFCTEWNSHVKEFLQERIVENSLRHLYDLDKSIRSVYSILLIPICRLGPSHPRLDSADVLDALKMSSCDSKSAMLQGLTILQLCLIIAMKHLAELYEGSNINFEMVYNEYQKFVQKKSNSIQCFGKPVCLKAFEQLIVLELVRPVEGSGFTGAKLTPKEYRSLKLLVTPLQVVETLNSFSGCPSELKMWATNPLPS
ncbi:origin recognition complex subunit 4-like [Apostichopus japonicus]|uniref:origin recognition complex subunit 4-like n=1 Tax=Stichopus japonicus TaxID=307972 RepID=UPI003AB352D3